MPKRVFDPWPWVPRVGAARQLPLSVPPTAVTEPATAPDTQTEGTNQTMPIMQATNVSGIPFNPGVYPARIAATSEAEAKAESKYDKGVPRQLVELRVSYRGETITCNDYITLYPKLGRRTKGYSLFSAVLFDGKEIPEGSPLDTDDLLNARVQIVVRPKPDGNGNFIESYMAYQAPVKKAKQVVVEDDDDDDLSTD